jgi:MOSC domain-containing protein YiiM
MFIGRLVGIYLCAEAAAQLQAVEVVRAVAGRGLDGDRYGERRGTWSDRPGTGREVTLVEREAIAAVNADGVTLAEHETRRNLVTEGVPLNHLVGRTFRVGEVVLQGCRLAAPCAHLEALTRPGVRAALVHRGGLRAEIVEGGVLRLGDVIAEVEGSA